MIDDAVTSGARRLGIELPGCAAAAFERYGAVLEEKNRVMNLTAISGEREVAALHFLDSLALLTLPCFETLAGASVIDVGSGAGFPGLPLKIAVPELALTLLDAQQKRVGFLRELCETLALQDVSCVHARAEEYAATARGSFDFAASRAVARLNVLCELCLPLVKTGGYFVAMKGADSDGEIREAQAAITLLGGGEPQITDYAIPGTGITHRAVVIQKTSATPEAYPRKFKKIQTHPL
ncbi:MAG: 16S rRNA (guanine(527)-N(7))-methyltransferase RsmG [Oscillospiraceae bacterium]|jgi:16S rRNA (guanine527-N7)-methyltransferase|nr:16S rRNA (guanine(527)-N(7))-methyltransferase RsmG [Oscillospiraceae bacterium]